MKAPLELRRCTLQRLIALSVDDRIFSGDIVLLEKREDMVS